MAGRRQLLDRAQHLGGDPAAGQHDARRAALGLRVHDLGDEPRRDGGGEDVGVGHHHDQGLAHVAS